MKILNLVTLIFFSLQTIAQSPKLTTASRNSSTPKIPIPKGYEKLAEAKGDLNKDSEDELVIVYNTGKQTDFGTERVLYVYQQISGKWKLWKQSNTIVLGSEHGGRLGDAFEGIEISRGCIVVFHTGGGGPMWTYTHRYRFNINNFYLIGATINQAYPCDSFSNYDYNLLTGKIEARIQTEKCDASYKATTRTKEKFIFSASKKTSLAMNRFVPGETEVKVPGREAFYY